MCSHLAQDQETKACKIFLVNTGDPFYADEGLSERGRENEWRRYIASYTTLEDTDRVDKRHLTPFLLQRNLYALGADLRSNAFLSVPLPTTDTETNPDGTTSTNTQPSTQVASDSGGAAVGERLLARFLGAKNEEKLNIRIALSYHMLFEPGTYEGFFEDMRQRDGGAEGVKEAEETRLLREEIMGEKFVMNNLGMKGLSREEVEKRNEGFAALASGEVKEVVGAEGKGGDGDGDGMEVDV